MPKNKEYHFYNDSGFDEKIEALGFKKAVKSIQNKLDLKVIDSINVEYINKKGNEKEDRSKPTVFYPRGICYHELFYRNHIIFS